MSSRALPAPLPFWFAVSDSSSAFFLFPFFFSGRLPAGVKTPSEMWKILQPIKLKSNGKVIGYFYRLRQDGILQYVSFASTVDAIAADKVEPATPAELEATKQRQREAGERG